MAVAELTPASRLVDFEGARTTWARLIFGALCGLAIFIFIAISASHGSTSLPSPAATGAAPATGAPATTTAAQRAAAAPRTVAKFSGSGQENTPSFTVSATWKLSYSYNCSAFGGSGNFIVFEDGGKDLNGVNVNQLGAGRNGTSWAYGDAGSHYLEVDSECDWSMTVTDEG